MKESSKNGTTNKDDSFRQQKCLHPEEASYETTTATMQKTIADTQSSCLCLDQVLGLHCLSIVLSFLEECDGATALLLSQKKYWTNTILPLLEVKSPKTSNANENQTTKPKRRHRYVGRKNTPAIKIPDATTRLDRLNTRRYNKRQRNETNEKRMQENPSGKESFVIHDTNASNQSIETIATAITTTASLAKDEWAETVMIGEANKMCTQFWRKRLRSIVGLPLLRFYDSAMCHHNKLFRPGTTCLASYPRSGNTLLRSLLESVTGFATSSDTRPDRTLSVALAENPPYFVGEGLAPPQNHKTSAFLPPFLDNNESSSGRLLASPPICKTHWPERIGCHTYDCQRVVLLVRNPWDATDSYWHMNLTNTHTEKVAHQVTEAHKSFYEALIRHEIIQVWSGFLDYYWKECARKNVPLLLVRYEDLVQKPKHELQRILEFCCFGKPDIDSSSSSNNKNTSDGTLQPCFDWWKHRLEEATRDENDGHDDPNTQGETKQTESTRSYQYGYRSSSSIATKDTSSATNTTSTNNESHPRIGRSLRKGMFHPRLLQQIHDLDDNGNQWLGRLGYHVYRQEFPENINRLPPLPVLEENPVQIKNSHHSQCGNLTINVQDVSLELRPRDSPYGRNMRKWRRQRTADDTEPFPTI